jgi:hypothetical protein
MTRYRVIGQAFYYAGIVEIVEASTEESAVAQMKCCYEDERDGMSEFCINSVEDEAP